MMEWIFDPEAFSDEYEERRAVLRQLAEESMPDDGIDETVESEYWDESMDGDHDSTMISIGWGTDEDYGYYGPENGGDIWAD